MKEFVISRESSERAVLVGLVNDSQDEAKVKEYLDELEFLADTAGAETVGRFTQRLDYPNPHFRRQGQARGNQGLCGGQRCGYGDL